MERMFDEATSLGVRFFPSSELRAVIEPPTPELLANRPPITRWSPRFELDFGPGRQRVLSGNPTTTFSYSRPFAAQRGR